MLKSFMSKPYTVHKKQFKMQVRVNGSGMDFADLVLITVCSAAKGDANKITQNNTPTLPIIAEATLVLSIIATMAVAAMMLAP